VRRTQRKPKAAPAIPVIEHPGRKFVPVAYVMGSVLLLAGSGWAISYGSMDPIPAVLMPWAGFYWGKLFFWRGVVS
jgi:hypothetical protein